MRRPFPSRYGSSVRHPIDRGIEVGLKQHPQSRRAEAVNQSGEQDFHRLAVLDAVLGGQEVVEIIQLRTPVDHR
jgi:hypothetical protein